MSGTTIAARGSCFFADFPSLAPCFGSLGLVLMFVPITYLTLIVDELVSKNLFVSFLEKMSGFTVLVMYLLMRLAMSAICLLSASTKAVVRILRVSPSKEPKVTEEDIRALIREAVAQRRWSTDTGRCWRDWTSLLASAEMKTVVPETWMTGTTIGDYSWELKWEESWG